MTERKEREHGLMILVCVFALALIVQSNPFIKASLILSIALLFCCTAYINWYIKLSK